MLLNSLLNKDLLKLSTAFNQVETPSPKALKNGSSRKTPIAAHSKSASMALLIWLLIGGVSPGVSGLNEPSPGFASFIGLPLESLSSNRFFRNCALRANRSSLLFCLFSRISLRCFCAKSSMSNLWVFREEEYAIRDSLLFWRCS